MFASDVIYVLDGIGIPCYPDICNAIYTVHFDHMGRAFYFDADTDTGPWTLYEIGPSTDFGIAETPTDMINMIVRL